MSEPSLRTAQQNRILRALPRAVLERILPDLTHHPLELRQVLQKRKRPVKEVVFPVIGVASMVAMGDSGKSVEVATIGYEGMVGLSLFLGGNSAAVEIFVQVPGAGLHMSAADFERHVAQESSFTRTLLLYTQALLTQTAQCAACNANHVVVQRCARWLLQTHDRAKQDTFFLTQEFLSLMLAVRRASVTDAAQELQRRKLIQYTRGSVAIVDRTGLEKVACECYRMIADEYDRLFASSRNRS
jgi:CRP-like cAMP-binding protein